jgi:AcrR family transcriptional regulator
MKRARSDDAKDERRQALLLVALDEFFQKGFTAARMDDIARRAGLSKGTLYLYFESKEALFTALIETLAMPNLSHIETISTMASTIREALDRLVAFAAIFRAS